MQKITTHRIRQKDEKKIKSRKSKIEKHTDWCLACTKALPHGEKCNKMEKSENSRKETKYLFFFWVASNWFTSHQYHHYQQQPTKSSSFSLALSFFRSFKVRLFCQFFVEFSVVIVQEGKEGRRREGRGKMEIWLRIHKIVHSSYSILCFCYFNLFNVRVSTWYIHVLPSFSLSFCQQN